MEKADAFIADIVCCRDLAINKLSSLRSVSLRQTDRMDNSQIYTLIWLLFNAISQEQTPFIKSPQNLHYNRRKLQLEWLAEACNSEVVILV